MSEGDILIFSEIKNGRIEDITFELISKGKELAGKLEVKLYALLLGFNLGPAIETVRNTGVDIILVGDHPNLADNNAEKYVEVIGQVLKDIRPRFFLLGYTYKGIEIGPAVAARINCPFVSNCLDLNFSDNTVRVIRPMYSQTIHAKIELQGPPPYIISFQKGVLPKAKNIPGLVDIVPLRVELHNESLRSKIIKELYPIEGETDITKAEIIVAVGRGIGDKNNIHIAKDLADAFGGTLACSRPVADLGWLPSSCHVGISGKTVAPKVYIACGISGASQHIQGIKESKRIIAINKNPSAPIFEIAHYGIVGDLFKIIPEITREAKMGV